MFTGIISGIGHITHSAPLGGSESHGRRLTIQTPAAYLDDVALGDSIALNGACMTATSFDVAAAWFTVDVSAESLARTAGLDQLGLVNLEKAMRPSDRLGGHMVSGHVDGVGTVVAFEHVGESWLLRIRAPQALAQFLAYKGSITVNGVSLTVNAVVDEADGQAVMAINLIPHTIQNTTLGELKAASCVNLEVDLIARYVARVLTLGAAPVDVSGAPPRTR